MNSLISVLNNWALIFSVSDMTQVDTKIFLRYYICNSRSIQIV